ncbi:MULTISPECIES: asparagine synthase (glutamine-hydrolyzing) [Streptomyces]|uniref:asparagine synthase (glutamine-hydrolyzing) n=1 Tax=Streptomyces evansiae TaxID=3075535 RepID=A0ABU2RAP7_9ACTN|nr:MULTISPECIES: asparagine synthase (glutamine-hydrolyzing) [unclassified Streptomyces]MDT0413771.1 asparagine synthase (glutamine-hydrolyzing) [Streptomyces sp. DSM 41979]MYQ56578.1 asparagine synthase (glutamine-hydrolyzing) [Streptomyces sp. SID4926]SCD66787.1 asparagine synthase (glutamine-hydrolysing) [Streptomyces sp. DfronAA-171]
MCGITGWVSYRRNLTGHQEDIDAMTQTMACRGPDADGVWVAPHAALGHRRLAVIDLPGGAQPMTVETPDGPIGMVYSGEAYNFAELRAELRRAGQRFDTDSDTEVVLRGYLVWGEELVQHLNGMYAFAIWDARTERLVMIRDRMGIKPFYYYETEDGVVFGSEPKAILANHTVAPVVGLDGLRELFAGVKTPGAAVWEGMREVRPGEIIVLDRGGMRRHTYWQLRSEPHTDSKGETVAHVRELLDDIVQRQLVADVPRCTLLSGGLDSSALTGLSQRHLTPQGETVRSFAVDFPDQDKHFQAIDVSPTQDTPYVHAVAEHVGCEHQDIILDGAALSAPAVRRAAVRARDLPIGIGDRDNSLYLLFAAVRRHSTVALSGESADEVFGGYPWFHDERRYAKTFPWLVGRHSLIESGGQISEDLKPALALGDYIAESYRTAVAQAPALDGETGLDQRMRVVSYLHLTRMVQTLLDRKDRMSMAVGLEVRVPFCDHRLVQYVFNTPWSLKTFDGREKSLLRAATRDVLPESVANRKKSGYPGTFDPAYVEAIQSQGADLLRAGHTAVELVSRERLAEATTQPAALLSQQQRMLLERTLDLGAWFDIYHPTIRT